MANPRTINLPGSLADTQQYELAPGLAQYVQSVRVVVDNTAGAEATPTISISEQSGVVIADVPQNGVLPAGEADGAATWALRLTDDAARSSGGNTGLERVLEA